LLFAWNIPSITIHKWLFNEYEMGKSLVRVIIGMIIVLMLILIGL